MSWMQTFQNWLTDDDEKEARKKAYQASLRGPTSIGPGYMSQGQLGQVASQHFAAQNNAIDQANDAVEQEMRSRVNQQREARRLQHEMEIERMRQETALRKIQAESDAQLRLAQIQSRTQRALAGLPITRTLRNGQWIES